MRSVRARKGSVIGLPRWAAIGLLCLIFLLSLHHLLPLHAMEHSSHEVCVLCALQMMPALLLIALMVLLPWRSVRQGAFPIESPILGALTWSYILHRGPPASSPFK